MPSNNHAFQTIRHRLSVQPDLNHCKKAIVLTILSHPSQSLAFPFSGTFRLDDGIGRAQMNTPIVPSPRLLTINHHPLDPPSSRLLPLTSSSRTEMIGICRDIYQISRPFIIILIIRETQTENVSNLPTNQPPLRPNWRENTT